MWLTLAVIFLALVWIAVLEIPTYVIVLVAIGTIVVIGLIAKAHIDDIDKVARAELIEEVPVYKREIEHTGFSIGYSWRSGRDYYQFKNVIDYYECIFMVVYLDGKTGTKRCRKGDATYNELIRKGVGR